MLLFSILAAAVGFLSSSSLAAPALSISVDGGGFGIQERQIKTDCAPKKCETKPNPNARHVASSAYSYNLSTTKSFQAIDACSDFKNGCDGILQDNDYKIKDFDIEQGCIDDKSKGIITAYCTYTEKASKGLSAFSYTSEVAASKLNYVPLELCKDKSKQVANGYCKVQKPDNSHVRFSNARA